VSTFDTVSNVQIGLSLPSIPKHVQAIRMLDELPIKVDHMPVRIALASNETNRKMKARIPNPSAYA